MVRRQKSQPTILLLPVAALAAVVGVRQRRPRSLIWPSWFRTAWWTEDATDTGYDLALVSTDLTASARQLVTRYAVRWSIEVTLGEGRGILGVGQAHHRTGRTAQRGARSACTATRSP